MKIRIKFVFAAIITLSLLTSVVSAATYYVATSANGGNDANPGTFALPWLTVGKAASVMVAGDTTYIRGGTYNVTATITPAHSGSPSNYITFAAYQDEVPILDAQAVISTRMFQFSSVHSYFRFIGLTIQHFPSGGGGAISVLKDSAGAVAPHHFEIINCTFKTAPGASCVKIHAAHDVIFAGCTFSNSKQGVELAVTTLGNTYNIQILDCKFSYMSWEGVVAKATHNSVYDPTQWTEDVYLAGCESSYNSDDGFDLFGRYFTIEHCIAHHIATGIDKHGFKVYALDLPLDPGRYHADFYRCLVYSNNREGYKLTSLMIEESTDYTKKFRMTNCTAAGDSYGISLVTNSIHPMDVTIRNSIISSTTRAWEITGTPVIWAPPPPTSGPRMPTALPSYLTLNSNYNLWYAGANSPINYLASDYSLSGWQTESGQDLDSISANPVFDANFHPTNAACIDSGTDVGLPYAGDAPDMGYFESGTVAVNCPANYLTTGENWISIPVAAINDGPYSIFKDLGSWPNCVYHNLYRYNSLTAGFVEYPTYQSDAVPFGKITPGCAYKLMLNADVSVLHASGLELTKTQELTIAGTGTRYFYFGDPFNKSLYRSNCRIKNGANEVSLNEAVSNGWINNPEHFNPASKSWETAGNILSPWHGYRLQALTAGELKLVIYYPLAGDLDNDGDVDFDDLGIMGGNWLANECNSIPVGNLDNDCDVDFNDYAILAGNWTGGGGI